MLQCPSYLQDCHQWTSELKVNGYNHWGYSVQIAHSRITGCVVMYLSISRPCQASALWGFSLAVCADNFLSQLIHNDLALQILH